MANRERLRQLKNATKDQLIATILKQEDMIANITMVARNEEIVSQEKTKEALLTMLGSVVPICLRILEVDHKFSKLKRENFSIKFYADLREIMGILPKKEEVPVVDSVKKNSIILQ